MLAYSYPLLGAFWTMFWLFLWIIWIFLLFRVIIDIFRSQDLSGWGKAGWLIFVIVLPFLGVFVYLIARGERNGASEMSRTPRPGTSNSAHTCRMRRPDKAPSGADELAKLADLRDRGVISQSEFDQEKTKILSLTGAARPLRSLDPSLQEAELWLMSCRYCRYPGAREPRLDRPGSEVGA